MPEIVLTIVTRRDCHLCDEMKAVVREVGTTGAIRVEERDVDADVALRQAYDDQVPVLLVNGRRAFKYRVTLGQLRRRIDAEIRRDQPGWWKRWTRAPR